MSNQRAGKTHRASLGDGMSDMKLRNFFRTSKKILEANGNEDAAFYFEQVEEHIQGGGSIMSDDYATVGRILGI